MFVQVRDTIHFLLADPGSNKCKQFKLSALVEEGRRCYKLDQYQRVCNNNHVVEGVYEGKKANPCNECKGTIVWMQGIALQNFSVSPGNLLVSRF